jgi:hypothetical protein
VTRLVAASDPRAVEGVRELERRLVAYCRTAPRALDDETRREVRDLVRQARADFRRRHGVAFPRMTVLMLPSVGHLELFRADLARVKVREAIAHLRAAHPTVSAVELASAIVRAWPNYRPSVRAEPRRTQ